MILNGSRIKNFETYILKCAHLPDKHVVENRTWLLGPRYRNINNNSYK